MPQYKDSRGRWRYRFQLRGKRHTGSTPKAGNTKAIAAALERQHIDKLQARIFTGTMPTFAAFVDRFLDHQAARTGPLTQRHQRQALKKHCVPQLGRYQLDVIGAAEIDPMITGWISAGAAPRTCNGRLDTLARLFSIAVEWKILREVPPINHVPVPSDTPRFLNYEEAEKLLAAAPDKWRTMILVGLRTGLRIGELRGLQWGDLDLTRRDARGNPSPVMQVRRSDPGRSVILEAQKAAAKSRKQTTKSKRERTMPLSSEAAAAIQEQLGRSKWSDSADFVWPGFRSRTRDERGRSRSENACTKTIRAIATAAGIQRKGADAVGWHTLRHTFASWLVMRNVPLRAVQELLGHASIRETERYAHLAPGFAQHSVVAMLDGPAAALPSSPAPAELPPGDDSE